MIISDAEQGSAQWRNDRAGIITASNFSQIITSKGKPSAQAKKIACQLAGERCGAVIEDGYKSYHMNRGNELEDEARRYYSFLADADVLKVGFCTMDDGSCGCSPDALVGEDGGFEVKCPSLAVHVEYLIMGTLPTAYKHQVQGGLYVTGRNWWDFMSYYPGMQPFIIRVYPDHTFHGQLEIAVKALNSVVDGIVNQINSVSKIGEK